MFGRVRRAGLQTGGAATIEGFAVLHTYRPDFVAGVAAVAMGTASVGSGAGLAHDSSGKLVSATAEAVTRTLQWGREAQKGFLSLPGRVLVVVTDAVVILRAWEITGAGQEAARWPRGSFTADAVKYGGKICAFVKLESGSTVILTGPRGPNHPNVRRTLAALVAAARLAET